ncbi:MAG: helix-hairpin-helix domain-containing protein [Gemmatimonadaceae bacterium]|nr:helix-hairpin-helix domain-containing protein [Gemmatimonadaceae bacterium]
MIRRWIGACVAVWCVNSAAMAQTVTKPKAGATGQAKPTPASVATPSAAAPLAATAIKSPGELDADMIDLNSASASTLRALPGIGEAYAEKIIKGRPYDRKDELVRRGILPKAVYKKMQNRVVARHAKP